MIYKGKKITESSQCELSVIHNDKSLQSILSIIRQERDSVGYGKQNTGGALGGRG